MNDKDIKTVEQIIDKCKNCELKECINCEINYNQVQAIENLLKENKELKKEKVVSQTTGRRNGKTIELAMQLRKELLELPEGKLYGIKNCKNKIIALTKNEVIPVAKIKEKIEELDTMIEKINRGELQKYTVSEIFTFQAIYEKLLEGK